MDKNKTQNKSKKPADPSRFEFMSTLEDGTGFKVLGSDHIFRYDKHGGWYDEYDNYYNAQGKPSTPPNANVDTKSKKPADPSRFENYDLLSDQTGFKIAGSDHIFYFDKYGGWYDEYENYYDADGVAGTPPEYSEDDEEEDDDDVEKLAKDYVDHDEDDQDEQEHFETLYLNTENKKIIDSYHKNEIQVKVWNLPFKTTEDDFEKLLVEKKIDWILFEFEYNDKDQFNGYIHLTFDKPNAEKFIELNGENFNGRPMKIKVQNPGADDAATDEEAPEEVEDEEVEVEGEKEEGTSKEKGPEETKSAETQ